MNAHWHHRFVDLALLVGGWSKDPSTQVGAVLIGPELEVLSVGYNGFPRGIEDTYERLHDRPLKYRLIVHAEQNAILNAARRNIPIRGSTLYVIASSGGKLWGGAPCERCAVEVVQAGIAQVVTPMTMDMPESWVESCKHGEAILKEAGVGYNEFRYYRRFT